MMKRETIPIADIYVPTKRRTTLEQKRVDELAASILDKGLQAPILVRADGARFAAPQETWVGRPIRWSPRRHPVPLKRPQSGRSSSQSDTLAPLMLHSSESQRLFFEMRDVMETGKIVWLSPKGFGSKEMPAPMMFLSHLKVRGWR
jgi:hypothetical protein